MNIDNREQKIRILEGYLKYPGESPLVDYKAAISFKEGSESSHKLVKHLLGMSNAGGGYLVIGYREGESRIPQPDPQLTDKIVSSYEVTRVTQFVNRFIMGEGKIDLLIYPVPHEGKLYPIIEVNEFKESPLFCKSSTRDGILKEGALYFRDSATRTIKIAGPSEWKQLVDICVRKKQDYVISQVRHLLKEVGMLGKPKGKSLETEETVYEWIEKRREKMKKLMHSTYGEKLRVGFWETTHWLPDLEEVFDQKILLEVAEKSQLHNTGWPIGVVLYKDDGKPKPLTEGIEASIISKISGGIDYWYFKTDGCYYFARTFEEDFAGDKSEGKTEKMLYFDIQIWRIAEALLHSVQLYNSLKVSPSEKIKVQISWFGISDRILTASPSSMKHIFSRKSSESKAIWKKETTLGELSTKWEDFTIEAANKLFLMFDYFAIDENVARDIIKEFKKSRI